jgi:hypothetical protein
MQRVIYYRGMENTQMKTKEHQVNPTTDRCVMCGRNRFQRENTPECTFKPFKEGDPWTPETAHMQRGGTVGT